jgi:chromosome segregation ATPase
MQFRNSFNRKNNVSQSNKTVDSTTDDNNNNNNNNNNNESSKQVLTDIIANYEEQLKKNQAEIEALVEEKQRLKDQVLYLDLRVAAVGEEREQYLSALNNAEGKLQFRVSQVLLLLCSTTSLSSPLSWMDA